VLLYFWHGVVNYGGLSVITLKTGAKGGGTPTRTHGATAQARGGALVARRGAEADRARPRGVGGAPPAAAAPGAGCAVRARWRALRRRRPHARRLGCAACTTSTGYGAACGERRRDVRRSGDVGGGGDGGGGGTRPEDRNAQRKQSLRRW